MTAPATSRPLRISIIQRCRFLALLLSPAIALAGPAADPKKAGPQWNPINLAELAEKTPKVEPNADAEFLLRDITLDQSSGEGSLNTYYERIKIFTQRGVEEFSTFALPYDQHLKLSDIAVRTIKPDGTTVDLDPKDIYNREVIKAGNIRVKEKAFSPPSLEPGAIVEYRYTETTDQPAMHVQMLFQSKIPSRAVRYKLSVFKTPDYDLGNYSFNCPYQPLQLNNKDECVFEMTDLKGIKEEPFQSPLINTSASIIVCRTWPGNTRVPAEYWGEFSKKAQQDLDPRTKSTRAITTALASIVSPGDSETDKIRNIYDYCRTRLASRNIDASTQTGRQFSKFAEKQTASDILKAGKGSHDDINLVFAALIRAAGMEARFAFCNDRSRVDAMPRLLLGFFMMDDLIVGVHTRSGWQYYDPGSIFFPCGMLPWRNCDTLILPCIDSGNAAPIPIEGAPAQASQLTRKATMHLNADGVLEGDVTETYSGYQEVALKNRLANLSYPERETAVRDQVHEYQILAEVTNIVVRNATSPTEQLEISYHLRIPEYADCTGPQLMLQPAVFHKNLRPWFEADTRENTIVFKYRYITNDEVVITPPAGYAIDDAGAPGGVDMGAAGDYTATLQSGGENGAITYKRIFRLSGLTFVKKFYPRIKSMFEEIRTRDRHTVIYRKP